jgi:nucleotide-binding universal stress UspA family protein
MPSGLQWSKRICLYILHEAESRDVNLVVMGAKGHSKVELVLMGSVTEKVVRETESIPVWVVK